ncbi:MAG: BlaI/MecI/CopY family transcriptional regulator [Nannocystaceae bacterium]|nr:BlaI/MecI/CopY family transcriptional regulator [bacterium]
MKGIRIRPEKRGLRVVLFDLEADIMDLVWSESWDTFSVQEVVDGLSGQRDLAYTTVLTTVRRLFDKGILDRVRDGRRYLYRSKMSREQFHEQLAQELMRSLPAAGREAALAALVDQVAEDDDEALDRLEAMIRARRGGESR